MSEYEARPGRYYIEFTPEAAERLNLANRFLQLFLEPRRYVHREVHAWVGRRFELDPADYTATHAFEHRE